MPLAPWTPTPTPTSHPRISIRTSSLPPGHASCTQQRGRRALPDDRAPTALRHTGCTRSVFLEIPMKPTPAPAPQAPLTHRETMSSKLLATADLLKRRRAADIREVDIDDYVAMHWLEWHGGSLRLTTTGENMCRHLTASLARTTPRQAA
jgi:hypothetical protein